MILAERVDEVDAFAVLATGSEGPELFYLAVHPRAWGAGLATGLLTGVADWARQSRHGQLRLWVIDDNDRARSVYERAGWVATSQLQRPSEGSRVERLYLRDLVAGG